MDTLAQICYFGRMWTREEFSAPCRVAPATNALARRSWWWALLLLLSVQPVVAQDGRTRAMDPGRSGIRVTYGPSMTRPFLDPRAHAPFAAIGEFRPAPGLRAGVGYAIGEWEAAATADFAGPELGEPFERDGISMGRHTSILRALGAEVRWFPAGWEVRRWRAWVSAGYVRSALDNVSVRTDQLPDALRELTDSAAGGETRPAGIGGSGVRVSAGLERDLSPTLALRLAAASDHLRYRGFTYGGRDFVWEGGRGWVPRFAVLLRWAP